MRSEGLHYIDLNIDHIDALRHLTETHTKDGPSRPRPRPPPPFKCEYEFLVLRFFGQSANAYVCLLQGNRSSIDSTRGDVINQDDETVVDAEQGNGEQKF